MIRATLLAACAMLPFATPAHAQWATETTQLASWVKQAADMGRQINGDLQRAMYLRQTLEAATRVTDLGSAVAVLNQLGIQNPLPVNPYALQGLLTGQGGATGMAGNLGGLYNSTLHGNGVYALRTDSWITRQIAANGAGIAGAQAVALQLYQSATERVAGLNELQRRIDSAPDTSEREALIARFGAEQSYIQNAQVQAQTVAAYMAAQYQLREQQREERLHQSIDEVLADAEARGWIGPAPAATSRVGS